ncbi:phage tail spike protein [Enterococcus casseliflavus]|uniref:phage tail spike protein n=1 Tax=Enterococcus casseliflavus TaxID=37734 RepID=UPI00288DC8A1|nr:phage tail spike protein [Enterococcus casseliflavus]MDT2954252.1 phage tail spike protein [Enterococcus casseliflavus]MDT2957522.1 phage tail spike protein [Enterococcus casseliflavus]
MSESIYFLNDEQELLKVCGESKIIESIQSKEITADKSELMNDTLSVSVLDDKKIRDAAFMAVRENDDSFSMYKITADSDPRGRLSYTGVNFAVDELHSFIVLDMRPSNRSIKQVAEQILGYTNAEWRVGYVDPTLPAISGTFYYLSVKDALKQLQTFGCEIVFKCKIDGNKITDKWIEIYKQIGIFSNKRFVYGSNALEVVRQRDRSQLYTSIIGRGKGEEVGDGYGRRIEFTDIEWKKSNGNPLDKPKGQNWLEYPEMTALYGIPMKNGSKRKRETVLILEDIEDPRELLQATYENLVEYSRPLIQFKTSVLGGDSIGNTVTIHRSDKNYHYKTRVFSVKIDRIRNKVECGLGDNLNTSSTRQAASVQNSVTNLAETKMTFYDSTEISKWQSDIIRGAHGGAVILMSPSDYPANHPQRGESRQPFQMVWMDGDSIQTSSHFLVANSDGIGFIDGDFYTSPFKTAWTIDGKFNADFIQTGSIIADIFETSFNKLGEILKLSAGSLQAMKNGKKIMELTSKGMEFWGANRQIGTIGTTDSAGNPFPEASTPTPLEDNSLVIKTEGDGKYILISTKEGYGWVFLGDGSGIYRGDVTHQGNVRITGDLDVQGQIRIQGQQVYPGGSGGGVGPGGATYDPINIGSNITGNANIVAWLEKYTKLYGISDYIGLAYALIMVENPGTDGTDDIMQSSESAGYPGPGYLTGEASVNQGCKHLAQQIKNGQDQNVDIWGVMQGYNFGSAYIPWLSNRGGVNTTDLAEVYSRTVVAPSLGNTTGATYSYVNAVSQADGRTYLYVNGGNFHYAAMIRQYVKVNESSGYVVPISKPVTVTSEFGYRYHPITGSYELHNGIDLVNGNATTPIYASAAGEVVIAGSYPDWYGNYVVIKHSDGLYTGYAHQSQLRVSVGDTVNQGQQIGNMGTTGPSTGPHLHFQFFTNGPWPSNSDFINPREHINF